MTNNKLRIEYVKQITIIDDHKLFSSGLELLLGELSGISLQSFTSKDQCLVNQSSTPSLIVLDFYLPGTSFSETFTELQERYQCPIIIVSASPSPTDRKTAMSAGAAAFINKNADPDHLLQTVSSVLNWEQVGIDETNEAHTIDSTKLGLSERQLDILIMVSKGYSNKEIAGSLGISPETVKSHLKTIFKRIEVQNRIEAVEFIRHNGVM